MKTKKTSALALLSGIMLLGFTARATETTTTSSVKVYPTPSHGKLVIECTENGFLKILDENGMLIKETPIYKGGNELQLSEMTAQRYVLQVKTGDESVVKRLTIK